MTRGDLVVGELPAREIAIDSARLRARVVGAVAQLRPRHRELLARYYSVDEPKLGDVARAMGITVGRASQIHKAAVDKLGVLLRKPA